MMTTTSPFSVPTRARRKLNTRYIFTRHTAIQHCSETITRSINLGRAIDQAVSRWLPTAAARVRARIWSCGVLWRTKWRWGRFSPSTSVSPANFHSTNCSTITLIYHLGIVQQAKVATVPRELVPPHKIKKIKSINSVKNVFY
jgi:hypothetical protein